MDSKKILEMFKIPTVALVVLGVINVIQVSLLIGAGGILAVLLPLYVPVYVPFNPELVLEPSKESVSFIIVIVIDTLSCFVLAYTGYSATRKYKLGLSGALLAGAIVGFVSSIINGIIDIILAFWFIVSILPGTSGGRGGGGPGVVVGSLIVILLPFVGAALQVTFLSVIGAVLGLTGGFIGQRMKSKQS